MIKRLSKRYELSEHVTSQLVHIMNHPTQTGDFNHEDDKYCVNVRIRETDFDIHLCFREVKETIDDI